jgi:hypothetical protein
MFDCSDRVLGYCVIFLMTLHLETDSGKGPDSRWTTSEKMQLRVGTTCLYLSTGLEDVLSVASGRHWKMPSYA